MNISPLLLRLCNISLRALTLLGRLLLMLLLARFLPVEDVGLFGLLFVTVNLGIVIAGFDFHAYSNREMLSARGKQRPQILFNQLVVYFALYLVLFPVVVVVFSASFLPWHVFGLFLPIFALEHLSYEAYRLFVFLGRQLTASLIVFMRGASWVLVLPGLFLWREDLQQLSTVLYLWVSGGVLSLLVALIGLHSEGWRFGETRLDIEWIKRGLRIALPFFIGTLALRSLFALDRYLIESVAGIALVGVYTFYMGMCIAMQGLIDAALFSFAYPKIVLAANAGDRARFTALLRDLALQTLVATTVLAISIFYLSIPLIQIVESQIYLEHLDLLVLILVAFSLFILGIVPQYGLYAIKADAVILQGNLLALLTFAVTVAVFYVEDPSASAVPKAMIVAFASTLVYKTISLLIRFNGFFNTVRD